ncbi:sensor histidine kinase [Deinococcus sp.]|uniref:sensor histidine kinase n=1 Tax=Deinococcus sp. TaxID=47478 RepID=UPI003C7E2BB7
MLPPVPPMSLPSDPFYPPRSQNVADSLSPFVGYLSVLLVYVGEALLIGSLWYAQPQALTAFAAWTGICTFVLFGLSYAGQAQPGASPRLRLTLAILMSVSSVAFNLAFSHLESYTALPLQVISAIVIVGVVPGSTAIATVWIVAQSLALAWANAWGVPLAFKLLLYPGYTVMQLFSAYLMKITILERAQRLEMIRLNDELARNRDMVAEASQVQERHRIARDLHDTLGHNLTALSLELEFARQVVGGQARDAVERAQEINRLLLSDVRRTVDAIRVPLPAAPAPYDLAQHFRLLGKQFPSLQLHIYCESGLRLNAQINDTLLKCAREGVTNAVRHASATVISVHLSREGGLACLHLENVAAPSGHWREGHGLKGMRERLEAIGGELRVVFGPTSFRLEARVPLGEQA